MDDPGRPPAPRSDGRGAALSARDRAAGGQGDGAAALPVLRRLVPIACRLVAGVRAFAVVAAVAAVVIVASLGWVLWPLGLLDVLGLVLLLVALAAAPLMVWLYALALEEIVELPGKVTNLPTVLRSSQGELASLVSSASARRRAGGSRARPGDLWRAGRLLLRAHDALPGYGAVLAIVRLPFLVATAIAALVCVALVLCAPVVVLAAAAVAVL
jgi:hypothetical protein